MRPGFAFVRFFCASRTFISREGRDVTDKGANCCQAFPHLRRKN